MATTCVQILNKIIVEAGFCDTWFHCDAKEKPPEGGSTSAFSKHQLTLKM